MKEIEAKIIEAIELTEQKLVQAEPGDYHYRECLDILGNLNAIMCSIRYMLAPELVEPAPEMPAPANDFVAMPQVPQTEPVAEEPKEEEPKYTYDQVRVICTEALNRGVAVQPIVAKYADKLSSLDPSQYAALVAEVQNA